MLPLINIAPLGRATKLQLRVDVADATDAAATSVVVVIVVQVHFYGLDCNLLRN